MLGLSSILSRHSTRLGCSRINNYMPIMGKPLCGRGSFTGSLLRCCHCQSWSTLLAVVTVILLTLVQGLSAEDFTVTASVKKNGKLAKAIRPGSIVTLSCEFGLTLSEVSYAILLDKSGTNMLLYFNKTVTVADKYKDSIKRHRLVERNSKSVVELNLEVTACFPGLFKCTIWRGAAEVSKVATFKIEELKDPVILQDGTRPLDYKRVRDNRTSSFSCGVSDVTEAPNITMTLSVHGASSTFIGQASNYNSETCLYSGAVESNVSLSQGDQVEVQCQLEYSSEMRPRQVTLPPDPSTLDIETTTESVDRTPGMGCKKPECWGSIIGGCVLLILIVVIVAIVIMKRRARGKPGSPARL